MLNLILIPNDQGEVWLHVGTGVSRHRALRGGRLSPDQRPALCRQAGSRQASAETGTPTVRGCRASGWGSAALRHKALARFGNMEIPLCVRRGVRGAGTRQTPASASSPSCSLSFKPASLHEHVHGMCDNVLGNLLFLASCHCSSEDVSGREPRSAVVLPMGLPVARAPCCLGPGFGTDTPTLGFELNRIEFVAGPWVPAQLHWSLRMGWCVRSVAVGSPPGPCQSDLLLLKQVPNWVSP